MPEFNDIPGTPEEWMQRATSDLALAKIPLPEDVMLEVLCYHAQQAAEKSIKAVYLFHRWSFRYSHDIDFLLVGL